MDPSVPTVSVKSIGIAKGLPFPLSIKNMMLGHHDTSKVVRYGICIPQGMNSHGGTGPGICAPYLSQLGWLDSSINANHIYLSEDGSVSGDITGNISANQGGLPIVSSKQ